jgi:hypothetical protein
LVTYSSSIDAKLQHPIGEAKYGIIPRPSKNEAIDGYRWMSINPILNVKLKLWRVKPTWKMWLCMVSPFGRELWV